MIYEIRNDKLIVKVNSFGAELTSVIDVESGFECIWQGDEKYWVEHSPVLFPFCGRNKDLSYAFNGKIYQIPPHGLAKRNEFTLVSLSNNSISLRLISNENTLDIYPFNFEFLVNFYLNNNHLLIEYVIKNTDSKEIIFSYGFHPGFNLPINGAGNFNDYYLSFSRKEYLRRGLINGLDSNEDKPEIMENNRFDLNHEKFNLDQFFKDDSDVVTLKSDKTDSFISMKFSNMTSLGLWKKDHSDAPYICIEPWHGFPGSFDKIDDISTRKEMIHLPINEEHKNSIDIEFKIK